MQERYGYPALTPALKRKVFGLNAARVYGLQPDAMRGKLGNDRVQRRKSEYLNDPRPTFATYGPRNRAEFLAFRRWQGDDPHGSGSRSARPSLVDRRRFGHSDGRQAGRRSRRRRTTHEQDGAEAKTRKLSQPR